MGFWTCLVGKLDDLRGVWWVNELDQSLSPLRSMKLAATVLLNVVEAGKPLISNPSIASSRKGGRDGVIVELLCSEWVSECYSVSSMLVTFFNYS